MVSRPAQQIGTLAGALGLAALCLSVPAWLRFGPLGLEALVGATLACLVPGIVLAVVSPRFTGNNRPLNLLLLGTGLRVGYVLLTGLALIHYRPALKTTEFLLGLALLYLVALAVETRQLLSELGPPATRQPRP